MAQDRKDTNEKRERLDDSDATGDKSSSNDPDVKRSADRKKRSRDDVTDIGTDAQQADGTAAGPSTS